MPPHVPPSNSLAATGRRWRSTDFRAVPRRGVVSDIDVLTAMSLISPRHASDASQAITGALLPHTGREGFIRPRIAVENRRHCITDISSVIMLSKSQRDPRAPIINRNTGEDFWPDTFKLEKSKSSRSVTECHDCLRCSTQASTLSRTQRF